MAIDPFKPMPLSGVQDQSPRSIGAGTRSSPGGGRMPSPARIPLPNPQPDGGGSGLGIRRAGMESTGVLASAVAQGARNPAPRLPGATSPAILQPGSFRVDSEVGATRPTSPTTQASRPTQQPTGSLPPVTVRPNFAGVNNGNARSVEGRDLGYGQQIKGVQVFSDGSGNIPRTMTGQQIAGLADGNRVTVMPSANFVRPGAGVAMSMASGGQTPALGSIPRPDTGTTFSRTPVSEARAAQLSAQHDMADIASGNMQSAAGRAASNLKRRAESGDPAAAAQLDAMMASAAAGAGLETQAAQTRMQEQGATQRAGMANATDLAREQMAGQFGIQQAQIQRPNQPIPLADGSMGILGQDGTVRPVTMADGTVAAIAPPAPSAATLRSRDAQANRVQKSVTSMLGQLVPPGAAPTAEHLRQAQLMAYQAEGLPIEQNENGEFRVQMGGNWVVF